MERRWEDLTDDEKAHYRERELRILRDWLIPSTLLVGICVSILLYIINIDKIGALLTIAAVVSIVSSCLLVYNILHIFGSLGEFEFSRYTEEMPSTIENETYIVALSGFVTFMVSVTFLCFSKSMTLGITSSIFSILVVVRFVYFAISKCK